MNHLRLRSIIILIVLLFTGLTGAVQAADPERPFRIFDGKPKRIHLISNSHGGGGELHAYLKRMPGAEKIEFTAGGGGGFVGSCKANQLPGYLPKEKLTDSRPVIYVVYHAVDTLGRGFKQPEKFMEQWDGASLDKYIMAKTAATRMTEDEIEGALASMKYQVASATAAGISLLIMSNTHFNTYGRGGASGMNGSEEVVRRWNATELGQRHPAVDVRTATAKVYPLCVNGDRFHTNTAAKSINAYHWFRTMCQWDGIEVPAWAKEMMDAAVAKEKAIRDVIQNIRLSPPGPYRVGDQVTITWDCDPKVVPKASIDFSPTAGMWAAQTIATNVEGGTFVWTIPEKITTEDHKRKFVSQNTVSETCYLRVNAPPGYFRFTEIPFQIKTRETKP